MKTAALSLAITFILLCLPGVANAADEFGNRFGNTSPAAFGDAPAPVLAGSRPDKNQATNAVTDIEPAAGGETSGETSGETFTPPAQEAKTSPAPAANEHIPRRAPTFSVLDFK